MEEYLIGKPTNIVPFEGEGFYISYNFGDIAEYGDVTTALVVTWEDGVGKAFYILNGNHTEQYKELYASGLDACLKYFKENIAQINKYSDKVELVK